MKQTDYKFEKVLTRPEAVRNSARVSANEIAKFVKDLRKQRYGQKGFEELAWGSVEFFSKHYIKQLRRVSRKKDSYFVELDKSMTDEYENKQ
jgi:hypothetical protein